MSLEHCTVTQVVRDEKTNEVQLVTDSSVYRQGNPIFLSSEDAHRFYQWCSETLEYSRVGSQFRTQDGVKLTVEQANHRYMVCYVSTRHEAFELEVHDGDVEELYSALEGK